MSTTLFTAWDYEVSILEFVAALTSLLVSGSEQLEKELPGLGGQ